MNQLIFDHHFEHDSSDDQQNTKKEDFTTWKIQKIKNVDHDHCNPKTTRQQVNKQPSNQMQKIVIQTKCKNSDQQPYNDEPIEQLNKNNKYRRKIKNYHKSYLTDYPNDNQSNSTKPNLQKYYCMTSQDEPHPQQHKQIVRQPNPIITNNQKPTNNYNQQLQYIQYQEKIEKYTEDKKISVKQHSITDIWEFEANTIQENDKYSTTIASLTDPLLIHSFLISPITGGRILQFQVHKLKKFLQTEYFLCIQYEKQLKYLACASNNSISLQKNVYTLSLKVQNTPVVELDKRQTNRYIGQFVSNFKRTSYTLYDHQNYSNDTDKILCTVATVSNFSDAKLSKHELYIPRVQNKRSITIYNNPITNTLKKMYTLSQTNHQITKLTSHPIPKQKIDKLSNQFHIIENTTRNVVVKDQHKIPKFFIIKIENTKFKIRTCDEITPLQIFCYSIAHLQ